MRVIFVRAILLPIFLIMLFAFSIHRHEHEEMKGVNPANEPMLHILDSIAEITRNADNPFCPSAQVPLFDNEIQQSASGTYTKYAAEYDKGIALLKLGNEKDAINIYTQLLGDQDALKAGFAKGIVDNLALANLRYGERTNCIDGHMSESCIFPITGNGMHQNTEGSEKAIQIYKGMLQSNPDDLTSRWLLNIAYMTLGEYPNKVPQDLLIPGLGEDHSHVSVKPFIDVAANLKLDTRNRGGGVVTDDFDNDGYLDIITTDWSLGEGAMHYFKNNGDGTFTDRTVQAGLKGLTGGLNMLQADYNNDGYTDIFILRGAWLPGEFGKQPNSLLRNNGDGTFTDVTIQSGLLSFHPTQTGVWRDFNNDGWIDYLLATKHPTLLTRNPANYT